MKPWFLVVSAVFALLPCVPANAQVGYGATVNIKETIETSEVRGYTTASLAGYDLVGNERVYGNWKEINESNLIVCDSGKLYISVVFDTNKGKAVDHAWWTFDARAPAGDAKKDPRKKSKYWRHMENRGGQWYVVIDLLRPFTNPDGSPIEMEGSKPWIPGLPITIRFLGNVKGGKESSTRFIFIKKGKYADITRATFLQISQTSLRDGHGKLLPQYGTQMPNGQENLDFLNILERIAGDGSGVFPAIETARKVPVGNPGTITEPTNPENNTLRKVKIIVEGFGQPLIVKIKCDEVFTGEATVTSSEDFVIDLAAKRGFTVWAKVSGGEFVQVRNIKTGDYTPYVLPVPGETRPLTLRPRAKTNP